MVLAPTSLAGIARPRAADDGTDHGFGVRSCGCICFTTRRLCLIYEELEANPPWSGFLFA